MKYRYVSAAAIAAATFSTSAWADEPSAGTTDIVVTATGLPGPRDEAGQAITVIDAKTIDRQQLSDVTTLLAEQVPSVRYSSNGSAGSATGVSLRGADSTQTLVLIDGVRINDASSIGDSVDFGNLLTGNIRRIEVLRGSNSVPYGSQAIGGVVNITTGEPEGSGLSGRGSVDYGYADTVNAKANVGYAGDHITASAGYSFFRTEGISSAGSQFGATERDGLVNHTANAKLHAALSDTVSVDLRGYYIDAKLDYDSFFGAPADSPDQSHFRQYISYAGLNADLLGGALKNIVSFTWQNADRDYFFAPGNPVDFGYRGKTWRAEYRGSLQPIEQVKLLFGYAHERPEYRFFGFGSDNRSSADTDSLFGLAVVKPVENLTVTGGIRRDWHSQFGGVTTYGANANWGLANGTTHIRASYGEGFKAPSLYQLFDTFSGNRDLQPERSNSVDGGIDQYLLGGRVVLSATVFHRITRNQIDFDLGTFTYGNIVRTRGDGVELTADLHPTDTLTIHSGYSYIDARDRSPGSAAFNQHLARRAAHSAVLSVDQDWHFGLSTGATLYLVGNSRDPLAPYDKLPGYALVGLRSSFALTPRISIYGRIDNLFDTAYATAYGYGTYGRSAYGGVRVTL